MTLARALSLISLPVIGEGNSSAVTFSPINAMTACASGTSWSQSPSSAGRHRPKFPGAVDLGCARESRLVVACRRQDDELQHLGRGRRVALPRAPERGRLGVGERRMVRDAPNLLLGGKNWSMCSRRVAGFSPLRSFCAFAALGIFSMRPRTRMRFRAFRSRSAATRTAPLPCPPRRSAWRRSADRHMSRACCATADDLSARRCCSPDLIEVGRSGGCSGRLRGVGTKAFSGPRGRAHGCAAARRHPARAARKRDSETLDHS